MTENMDMVQQLQSQQRAPTFESIDLDRLDIQEGILEDTSENALLIKEVLGGPTPEAQHFCNATDAFFKSVGVKNDFMMDEAYLSDIINKSKINEQFKQLRV